MSSLTGSPISGTYDRLLSLPSGGGSAETLVPITDGDGTTTFALQMSTDKVDIQGGLTIGVDGTGFDVKFFGDTATNGYMLWDQSRNDLILGSASNIGVGRVDPSAPLHLTSSTQSEMLKIDTANFSLQLGEDADLDNFCRLRLNSGDGFHFTGNDDGPDLTILSASGNVGVGTAAPASKFHVTGTVQVGVNDTGHDVKFYGATDGAYMLWDESEDRLELDIGTADGNAIMINTSNNREKDITWSDSGVAKGLIRFHDDTSGTDANDRLEFGTATDADTFVIRGGKVGVVTTTPNATLHVAGSFAAAGPSETFQTFSGTDTTPSVANGNLFKTHASGQTLTMFDDGVNGQIITVISTAAVVFAVSGNLQAGTTNITTASGDVTQWVFDGTNWYLLSWLDDSIDLSSGGF